MNIKWYIIIIFSIIFGNIGLLLSKIRTGLSWSILLKLKYEILVLVPIVKLIDSSIEKRKLKIKKLYKIKNKLEEKITL